MKPDLLDTTASFPRRRWLGAIAAAAGAAWAWRARGSRTARPAGNPFLPDRAASTAKATHASAPVTLAVRPSPDSVKRHG
ncbi:MAG TPA: hypothetical protein VF550_18500 [Polyangia bacterium]